MEFADFGRIIFGLVAVIGMIGLVALAAKKAGLASASGGFVRKRRLAVVETLALDGRRRLAIVKCDDKEHLIVLGASNETLIEQDLDGAPLDEDATAPETANPFAAMSDFAAKFRAVVKDQTDDDQSVASKDAA